MTLVVSLLVFVAAMVGGYSLWRWRHRPDQSLRAEARLRHPTAIEPVESHSSAVRVLRSDDDLTSALERANASAARIAATRASRRYARTLAKPR
jgi:hypothetical protein